MQFFKNSDQSWGCWRWHWFKKVYKIKMRKAAFQISLIKTSWSDSFSNSRDSIPFLSMITMNQNIRTVRPYLIVSFGTFDSFFASLDRTWVLVFLQQIKKFRKADNKLKNLTVLMCILLLYLYIWESFFQRKSASKYDDFLPKRFLLTLIRFPSS